MGNPHAVIFVDEITDDMVWVDGKALEVDAVFPERANIEFVQVINRNHIKMRVWERGSGETFACGTGSCACVVAGVLNGLTDRNVTVSLLGGDLEIEWNEDDNRVYMTGPAVTVFEGEI
jgi:diaminopimelate epimerase